MINLVEGLNIYCYWRNRPIKGAEFLQQARAFLQEIQKAFPALSVLQIVKSEEFVSSDYSNFEKQMMEDLAKSDMAFLNPDPSYKGFTLQSTAAVCFSGGFLLNDAIENMVSDSAMYINLGIGATDVTSTNVVSVHINDRFATDEVTRSLFRICISFWQPHNARVSRGAISRKLKQPRGEIRVGLLTYLSDKSARNVLPSDVEVELLSTGILIQAGSEHVDVDDDEGIKRLTSIAENLRSSGYLAQ